MSPCSSRGGMVTGLKRAGKIDPIFCPGRLMFQVFFFVWRQFYTSPKMTSFMGTEPLKIKFEGGSWFEYLYLQVWKEFSSNHYFNLRGKETTSPSEVHYWYLQKISEDFNFGQKKCLKIKPSKIFKHPKILRYSDAMLVSQNKSDVTSKGLEMAGIVKAVTKKLEPEDPFKIFFVTIFLEHFPSLICV